MQFTFLCLNNQPRQGEMKKAPCQPARGFFTTLSELFSSFLRGASCLKSPRTRLKEQRTIRYRNHKVSRPLRLRQGELFQVVKGGISRFEDEGSAVLDES